MFNRILKPQEIFEAPALTLTIIRSLMSETQINVAGGMGLPDGFLPLPQTQDEAQMFLESVQIARFHRPATWRGFDIRHLNVMTDHFTRVADDPTQALSTLEVLAAFDAASEHLTQDTFDFITCRDIHNARVDSHLVPMKWADLMQYDPEQIKLMAAFAEKMENEAEPFRHRVACGAYVMQREPFEAIDNEIHYDHMRLLIMPQGIACTLIAREEGIPYTDITPFFWTPGSINTAQVFMHTRAVFAIGVMMSCIWRDACVVREKFVTEQKGRKGYEGKIRPKPKLENPVVLPRVVYRSTWGSPQDREQIEQTTKSAHTVRGHYRELPEGWNRSAKAEEKADAHGFPVPPDGYTFVEPHVSGQGGDDLKQVARRVVCRGLHVARITLGK